MRLTGFILFLFLSITASAQQDSLQTAPQHHIGLSAQLYPAGYILTSMGTFDLNKSSVVIARIGVNLADRKDFSPYNDNEIGWGFGATIGYRKIIAIKYGEIFGGINLDLWNMWIDWRNDIGKLKETNGKTYTFVVQPWVELGYQYMFKNTPIKVGASFGFGREINVITNGKNVGQGWMRSLTLSILYRIRR